MPSSVLAIEPAYTIEYLTETKMIRFKVNGKVDKRCKAFKNNIVDVDCNLISDTTAEMVRGVAKKTLKPKPPINKEMKNSNKIHLSDVNKKEKLDLSREIVDNDYKSAINRNKESFLDGNVKATSEYIYENQKIDAHNITEKFHNDNLRCISIIKRTKVGMDGLMIEIAKNITTHSDVEFVIHWKNVFFLTGMSNKTWENDFKEKIPNCFKENVYHHGQLQKSKVKLENIQNALIIIDEIDNGDKNFQKLHNILKNNGLLDIKYMEENNIRFIFVSATIKNELDELKKWGDKHEKYSMTIPDNYISHNDFLERGIIKEYYEINNYETAEKWVKKDIIDNYGDDFRVHIIRTDKNNVSIIKSVCLRYGILFKNHTSADRISDEDLTDIFDNKVKTQHIVLAIKGFYRRATLIPNQWKEKIGATHERCVKNFDTNVQIQGLPGRMTGYWKDIIENGHKTGPHRCAIEAIEQYEEFFNDPSNQELKYDTNGSKKIFLDPRNINNLKIKEEIINNNKEIPVIIEIEKDNPIFKEKKFEIKNKIIESILKNKNENRLLKFIKDKDTICGQISNPKTDGSYKKHITDVVQSADKNKPYSLSLKPEIKKKNNYQVFIDSRKYRLCFVIWSLDSKY